MIGYFSGYTLHECEPSLSTHGVQIEDPFS